MMLGLTQEDHSMWTESLLFHTLPEPIGKFLENYSMPLIGEHSVLQLLPPFLILLVLCCSMLRTSSCH